MDVEAPSNAPAGSVGGERMTRPRAHDTKGENLVCKGIGFLLCYGLVYAIGEFFIFIIYAIVYAAATAAKVRMDVGIWCGIWFVLTQAWGVTLGVLTVRVTRGHLQVAAGEPSTSDAQRAEQKVCELGRIRLAVCARCSI